MRVCPTGVRVNGGGPERGSTGVGASWRSALCALAVIAALPLTAAAATTVPHGAALAPTYARTIGVPGEAITYPSGLAVDSSGDVYVADTGNDRVEKYLAGTTRRAWSVGVRGAPIGGGTDSFVNPRDVATDGTYVYVADTDNQIVQVLRAGDGRYVTTMSTVFGDPIGVTVGKSSTGSEVILVSDGVSGEVYVFNSYTDTTPRLTIPPTAKNEGTRDAATDSQGNIYTADYRGNKVDKYSATGTLLMSWGTSSGCQQVSKPYGVQVDANDHVYVASSNLEQVKVFRTDGTCLNVGSTGSNAIGTAGTGAGQIFQLRRVAVGAGKTPLVYLADLWGLKILTYSSSTGALSHAQPEIGNGVYPAAGALNEPHGVAVTSSYVFTADMVNQRIDRFNLDGSHPIDWGTKGTQVPEAAFNWAQGIAIDPASGNVWVANTRNNVIDEFPVGLGTPPLRTLPTTGRGASIFNWPMDVAFDPAGNMYVADTFNNDIQSFSVPSGTGAPTLRWTAGSRGTGNNQFLRPWSLVFDPTKNRLLVADADNSRIISLDPATGGSFTTIASGKGSGSGQFRTPSGITVDSSGNIWVADTGNNRLEELDSTGAFQQAFGHYGLSGTSSFNAPQGLAIAGGLLYVADAYNNRVQVYTLH